MLNLLLGRNGSMGEHDLKLCFFCVKKFPLVSFLLTFDPEIKGIYYSYLEICVSHSYYYTLTVLTVSVELP
jgi:hypothetical protein